jgi:DNA-binding MarR family transcriptional regulator
MNPHALPEITKLSRILWSLSQQHPAIAARLQSCAATLQRHILQLELQKISYAIEHCGCNTVADLADELQMSPSTVQKRLRLLMQEGVIYRVKYRGAEKARGGDRRSFLYWVRQKNQSSTPGNLSA